MGAFIQVLFENPKEFITHVLVMVFSICVHEFAHAWVALKRGDDTAARSGHLSLNPLVQMGPTSLVMLLLFGLAWGQVPISPVRMRRVDRAVVAFSGPAANLLLCLLFALVAALAYQQEMGDQRLAFQLAWTASAVNGMLFTLNMLPLPVFDGWSVLGGFFPAMENLRARMNPQMAWIISIVFLLSPAVDLVLGGGRAMADLFVRVLVA